MSPTQSATSLPKRFSKRSRKGTGEPQRDFSRRLSRLNRLIQEGKIAESLSVADALISQDHCPLKRACISSLVADSQFRLGRYDEAAEIFKQAKANVGTDTRAWFRPAMGEIRSLLKSVRVDEAISEAGQLWNLAAEHNIEANRIRESANSRLKSGEAVTIPPRPIRPSVVLTKLGLLFLQEGYLDPAKQFFQQAILTTPRGATRAREAMARISLSEGLSDKAEQYAREALLMGKFQAKTVSVWALLLKARQLQGKDAIDLELITSLRLHASGSVCARSFFTITTHLRNNGDSRWEEFAEEAQGFARVEDRVIEVELLKLRLSELKGRGQWDESHALAAWQLIIHPMCSPSESVGAAKSLAQCFGYMGSPASRARRAFRKIGRRFGPRVQQKAIHSAAIGLMLARRHDLARTVLQDMLKELPEKSQQWRKSMFALARMEAFLQRPAEASNAYFKVASAPGIPERFETVALVRGMRQLAKIESLEEDQKSQVEQQLRAAVSRTEDCRVKLDIARELVMAGALFEGLASDLIAQAERDATTEFHKAENPSEAIGLLLHLTRRQYHEFCHYSEIVGLWNSLDEKKRSWLWSRSSKFWEYQSIVFDAFVEAGLPREGEKFALDLLEQPTTPPEGRVFVGSRYANWKNRTGYRADALEIYRWVIDEGPTHPWSAKGYHALGLDAWRTRGADVAKGYFEALRRCFATRPNFRWQRELDAQAWVFLSEECNLVTDRSAYSDQFIAEQKEALYHAASS